ncbi:MAG: flavodoxin domain-containing protein [Candidatus Bathyarchaeia archaeon]
MKVLIVYDSKTGNTEKMAEAIAEGINSVNGVYAEVKKIDNPWPLSSIAEADIVLFGSPVNYADVTDGLRSFLEHLGRYIKDGKLMMAGRRAAIFGSYGWDGAWIMEDRLRTMVSDLGFKLYDKVLVKTDNEIRNRSAETLPQCREFGREIAESLR